MSVQVLYGLDYTASDQKRQHELVKEAVIEHIKFHPQSLIVIEEYDKLDCRTRGLLKQLIDSSHSTNVSINRFAMSNNYRNQEGLSSNYCRFRRGGGSCM